MSLPGRQGGKAGLIPGNDQENVHTHTEGNTHIAPYIEGYSTHTHTHAWLTQV